MIRDILERIDERLEALGLAESRAAKMAGLSDSAIRDIRRAVKNGRQDIGVSTRTLAKLAPVLDTTMEWLMTGGLEGRASRTVPLMGYIGAGAEVEPEFEQVPPEGLDRIELPFSLDEDLIAFRVRGDSMLPMYEDGTVVIVYREQTRPLEALFGRVAAVRTTDGRRFIKTITRGPDDTVTLTSHNANPIEGVKLEWIGEIFATLPPTSLRKTARRSDIRGQARAQPA